MNKLEKDLAELGLEPEGKPLPVLSVVAKPPHEHWERCKAWIEAGLMGGLIKIADVEAQLADGSAILWPGRQCAIVSEFVTYPSGERAAQVMSAGGDMDEILSLIPGMEAFGRLNGCAAVTVQGRRGWEKVLKASGYEFLAITLKKAL
jgi:hypothetical protein